jgi:large subunit ribosomal protein L34e
MEEYSINNLYKPIIIYFTMVSGVLKSRRLKRVQVRLPGGSNTTHYIQRNRSIVRCAVTKKPLRGIPRLTNRQFKNLNKSQKTVSRAYGGYMSHSALKSKILKEMVFE